MGKTAVNNGFSVLGDFKFFLSQENDAYVIPYGGEKLKTLKQRSTCRDFSNFVL